MDTRSAGKIYQEGTKNQLKRFYKELKKKRIADTESIEGRLPPYLAPFKGPNGQEGGEKVSPKAQPYLDKKPVELCSRVHNIGYIAEIVKIATAESIDYYNIQSAPGVDWRPTFYLKKRVKGINQITGYDEQLHGPIVFDHKNKEHIISENGSWIKLLKGEYSTKGGTFHKWGDVQLKNFREPAKVHYSRTRKGKEKVQIILPVSYVVLDWLQDGQSVSRFFFNICYGIASLWTEIGYMIKDFKTYRSGLHYAFHLPIFDSIEDFQALRISNHLWFDHSEGLELETNREEMIPVIQQQIKAFLNLPELHSKVKELEKIVDTHEDVIGELVTVAKVTREVSPASMAKTIEFKESRGLID